ncbi:DEKNAAC104745 [Brettanomyces naardenensis]|uniref:Protein BTN n=1 Tax=Brettanomyces naardenensis TaxID=13370 RepID=A0A448YRB9_BRENA|nr:DEKNAAC104745 [Brettanomyces naardenensis]
MSLRVFSSFWIFGLVNNVLYVIILSAAIDLVGPTTPKAVVLMADVLPSFICKITAPFYIHIIPYNVRICVLVFLSCTGMIIISLFDNVILVLLGIVLASMSSGLGEITFLQLTHYYSEISLHAWSSGTGGAGLVGSFLFMLMTTIFGINPQVCLLLSSLIPFVFIGGYFYLLPERPSADNHPEELEIMQEGDLVAQPKLQPNSLEDHIRSTLLRLQPYLVPYMGPLFTVYIAEYIINQGVSPTLLFILDDMPFHHYRDAYVTYGTLYQLGVFISRSSGAFIKIDRLYILSALQVVNLAACIFQSLFVWLPNIYLVMILVFYEGLLGGLSYINTFRLVTERTRLSEREFAMGCVTISDSGGIVVAAAVSMLLEPSLCGYQVSHGRPWCRQK